VPLVLDELEGLPLEELYYYLEKLFAVEFEERDQVILCCCEIGNIVNVIPVPPFR